MHNTLLLDNLHFPSPGHLIHYARLLAQTDKSQDQLGSQLYARLLRQAIDHLEQNSRMNKQSAEEKEEVMHQLRRIFMVYLNYGVTFPSVVSRVEYQMKSAMIQQLIHSSREERQIAFLDQDIKKAIYTYENSFSAFRKYYQYNLFHQNRQVIFYIKNTQQY